VSTQGSTSSSNDLLITIDGIGAIQIDNAFNGASLGSGSIESIVFSDTSTLNLTTVTTPDIILTGGNDSFTSSITGNYSIYGNDGNDTITLSSTSGTHTIDGGLGNDAMSGGSGDDTYIASPGFDTIAETSGDDTIVIPAAVDPSDVTLYRINDASGPTYDLGISMKGLGRSM
jgi:Ca2+-binding RTX toxin-like protein